MSSKLDYLKKYLAKPGDAGQTQCQKKKKKVLKEPQSLQIRDLSEVLPQSRIEEPIRKRRPIDEEVTFVDEKQVEAAQKLNHEISGVKWKIMQHRKGPPREALRGAGLAVKKEEPEDSDISPPRASKRSANNRSKSPGDDDLSPPRAARGGRQQKRDDSDLSPPRKETIARQKADDSDLSPPRADAHAGRRPPLTNSEGDLSPPRASAHVKNEQDSDKDLSPPRRAGAAKARERRDSDADLSPPRKSSTKGRENGEPAAASAQDPNSDLSPPRDTQMTKRRHVDPNCQPRLRHDSDADLSPPRQGKAGSRTMQKASACHDSDADLSPPRQGKGDSKKVQKESARHDSDADLSSPRQGQGDSKKLQKASARHDSDADLSPPRQGQGGSKKLQKSTARHDSDADLSPPRQGQGDNKKMQKASARHDSDADLSPPRQGQGDSKQLQKASARHDSGADLSPAREQRHQRHDSDVDLSPPRREDRRDRKGEEQQKMSSGLRAGLVKGQDLKSEAAVIREKRKAELEKAPDNETGRGAETVYRNREGQRIGREEWAEQQQKKRRKKLSEYPEQELEWGGGIKQKYNKEAEQAEVSRIAAQPFARYKPDDKYLEELQDRRDWNDPMRQFEDDDEGTSAGAGGAAPKKEVQKPKCPHAPWLNRFNILPGYRWDGKVRGNDYERKWLESRNQREYDKQEAWKYDMEEM